MLQWAAHPHARICLLICAVLLKCIQEIIYSTIGEMMVTRLYMLMCTYVYVCTYVGVCVCIIIVAIERCECMYVCMYDCHIAVAYSAIGSV